MGRVSLLERCKRFEGFGLAQALKTSLNTIIDNNSIYNSGYLPDGGSRGLNGKHREAPTQENGVPPPRLTVQGLTRETLLRFCHAEH